MIDVSKEDWNKQLRLVTEYSTEWKKACDLERKYYRLWRDALDHLCLMEVKEDEETT